MTKLLQQTIGNTVFYVGQELKNYTEAGPLIDAWCNFNTKVDWFEIGADGYQGDFSGGFVNWDEFPIRITALPNPDPVENDWRVVVHPDKRAGGYPEAMQEVCKADEVKLEWPLPRFTEYCPKEAFELTGNYAELENIVMCFLLGGTVKVRGGL